MREALLFFAGCLVGSCIFRFVLIPLCYGLPKALFWVAKGRSRPGAIWYYLRVVAFSNLVLFTIGILFAYVIPSLPDILYTSIGFYYGRWAGLGLSFLYVLTTKGRCDLAADFSRTMRSRYSREPIDPHGRAADSAPPS